MNTKESGDVTLARQAFAEALRVEMARAGVNLRELEALTRAGGRDGIAETTIGKYSRGERSPLLPAQFQLEEALGLELGTLTTRAVVVYQELKAEADTGDITR